MRLNVTLNITIYYEDSSSLVNSYEIMTNRYGVILQDCQKVDQKLTNNLNQTKLDMNYKFIDNNLLMSPSVKSY